MRWFSPMSASDNALLFLFKTQMDNNNRVGASGRMLQLELLLRQRVGATHFTFATAVHVLSWRRRSNSLFPRTEMSNEGLPDVVPNVRNEEQERFTHWGVRLRTVADDFVIQLDGVGNLGYHRINLMALLVIPRDYLWNGVVSLINWLLH